MAAGDERAAADLYDRHGGTLYALAFRIVGERADAEEVVMEAFTQAWREAARFQSSRGSVGAWLTIMVRSRALDVVRARGRRARITATAAWVEPQGAPAMGAPPDDPGEAPELAERRRMVAAALKLLPSDQRQAIELAYFGGLSQSEIAEQLRTPLGTVKTRIRTGMQTLRDALRPLHVEQVT